MNFRHSIATATVAAALGALALPASAANHTEGYGRAGGMVVDTAARMVRSDAPRSLAQTPMGNWYGREGRPTGPDMIALGAIQAQPSPEGAAELTFPGRQGRPLPIDEIQG